MTISRDDVDQLEAARKTLVRLGEQGIADPLEDFLTQQDNSPYPTQAEMNAEDAQEYYRLAAWLHGNREDTWLAGEPIVDWAIRLLKGGNG